ncbi:MAG TPA: hypothetical protein VJM15_00840 [Sphingomicrobium sp.]|nr:hypothetical protein [Sphingomicrobium sp.]
MATHIPTQARVKAAGSFVALVSDQHAVAGCSLTGTPGAVPCVVLAWTVPATRVRVSSQPVLVQTSQPIATGPGIVMPGQTRVMAT